MWGRMTMVMSVVPPGTVVESVVLDESHKEQQQDHLQQGGVDGKPAHVTHQWCHLLVL